MAGPAIDRKYRNNGLTTKGTKHTKALSFLSSVLWLSNVMEWHPFAKLFPMLPDDRLQELADDIASHGLQHPIVIDDEERILDGRNRAAACLLAGVTPVCEPFVGSEREKLELVVSLNIHRRHLTESQRAMIAAKVAETDTTAGRPKKNGPIGPNTSKADQPVTRRAAADALAVSENSVKRARKVASKGTPDLQQAVSDGDISVSAAASIAEQPPEEQNKAVERAKAGEKPYTPHGKSKKHQRSDQTPPTGFSLTDLLTRIESLLSAWNTPAVEEKDRQTFAAKLRRWADQLDPPGTTGASKRFVPPTVEDVRQYCEERSNGVDPEAFCDFYVSCGWKVGSKPMKDWQAAVRTWEKRHGSNEHTVSGARGSGQRRSDPARVRGTATTPQPATAWDGGDLA